MTLNDELQMIRKEAVGECSNVMLQYLLEGTEENHGTLQQVLATHGPEHEMYVVAYVGIATDMFQFNGSEQDLYSLVLGSILLRTRLS
jgi:hypothetical protein